MIWNISSSEENEKNAGNIKTDNDNARKYFS